MDDRVAPKPRKRVLLPPVFVRAMLAGHSALGLAFAALIYVVCLTGTLAVFAFEFQRWEQPNSPIIETALTSEAVGAAVAAAHAQAVADNSAHDLFILGPGVAPRLSISYHDHETGVEGHWLGDADGKLVARVKAPFTEFLTALHINLHLPRTWGRFIVGLTGVALLSSLISGLLSHPRIFRDAFALRWGGSMRLQEADLHNRLSVWGLPFHIVVSLTGALLGLSTLIVGVLAYAAYDGDSDKAFATILGPRATEEETGAPLPDVAAMIRHVQQTKPDAVFVSVQIQHIAKAGQVVHLGMRTPGHLALSNSYYFKGDGTPIGDGGLETGSVGQQILGLLQPLHFGWFGGIYAKVVYGIVGLALTIVTHSGVAIWLARRRDKGRPAPTWERIWAAVAWGQPLALAAAALAALLLAQKWMLPTYITLGIVAIALALALPTADAVGRILRVLSTITLIATVAAHAIVWSTDLADTMACAVSAAAVGAAFIIVAADAAKCISQRGTTSTLV
jgi:uncharacterized iron-regulated membrane protein